METVSPKNIEKNNINHLRLFVRSWVVFFFYKFRHIKYIIINKQREEIDMAKKLSKKELEKLEIQMGISKVQHDRPPVGRPTVFYGKTNKQKRREGRQMVKEYW